MRARWSLALFAFLALGCQRTPAKGASRGAASKEATCASVTASLTGFGELLEETSADAKLRAITYAGLLELLLSFEGAASDLDRELGAVQDGGADVDKRLKAARASLTTSAQFARTERDAVEKHAHAVAPLAKETQQAWTALRGACEPKRGPAECGAVREVVGRFDAAETTEQHERAVGELVALRLSSNIGRARDRAVAASRAVQAAIKARAESSTPVAKRWASVQKDLAGSMNGLIDACKGESPATAELVVADHPDPRKLTVLVHVKPPAGVERSLLSLARASTDEDERAFYQSRAEGAFGSGFFLVKKTDAGTEVLIVTNRHVVELGERAVLELADGTALGVADVVYASPTHDLAVLRPATKLGVKEGFAFARTPAKDQQTVIATGFPGLVGRPSYQTTKGYVSNESFRLDDGARPLTYVQHTAPIDPGSSGGPLTDESGRVLGVNTLKVTGREAVGLAVPSKYVIDTLRTAGTIESRHASSSQNRQKAARLACLGFLAELGATEPRMLVLEQMISNHLVGAEGLDAAATLSGEEGFEHLWNTDSVRAMRIATLVRVRSGFMAGGGPSVLETCDDVEGGGAKADQVKYRVRLGNFEARELGLRWEQGRWKVDSFEGRTTGRASSPKRLPPPGPPSGGPPSKRVAPPGTRR